MKELRIGILGAGRIGSLHAQNLVGRVSRARVLAVADIKEELARQCARELGIPQAFGDPLCILENKEIEAVFICTSTETHAPLIEAAASFGKHIFCEKPIALDLPSIDRALHMVQKAQVKLQIGFNRRFDPNFARIRQMICDGVIGRPEVLRITSRDPAPPSLDYLRVSGGIFLDMTIHDFDMARFLLDQEVTEVFSTGSVLVDQQIGHLGDVDTAVVVLRFRSGSLGIIDNSRRACYGYDQRVEVLGEKGLLQVENPRIETILYSDRSGAHGSRMFHFFLDRYAESFVREAQAFVDAVLEDKPPPVGGKDGRMSVLIAQAAQQSLVERRPVTLEEASSRCRQFSKPYNADLHKEAA